MQDSQVDQPMADETFMLKIKIYLCIYISIYLSICLSIYLTSLSLTSHCKNHSQGHLWWKTTLLLNLFNVE